VTPALTGWRVLVPRAGDWGDRVARSLAAVGAEPVVAPLVRTEPVDSPALRDALDALIAGEPDWLVVTSAATVDVLRGRRVGRDVRVAAVGPATAEALRTVGLPVHRVPSGEHSAAGLVDLWPLAGTEPEHVLLLCSDLASPELAEGLRRRGHRVERVVAYRTRGVPLDAAVRVALSAPGPRAVLVTSGSVAQALAAEPAAVRDGALVACLGPRTARAAREAGLPVHLVAPQRTAAALVTALAEHVLTRREQS